MAPFSGSSKPPSSLFLLARWCGILRSEQVPGLLCDSSTPWQLAAPRRCQLRRGLGGGALEVSLLDSMLRIWTASFGIHYRKDSLHVLPLYRKAPSPLPSNTSFRRTSTQSPGTLTKARHHVAAQSLVWLCKASTWKKKHSSWWYDARVDCQPLRDFPSGNLCRTRSTLRTTCQVQSPATSLVDAGTMAAALPTQSVRKRRFLGQVVQALRSPIPAQQAGFSTGLEVVEALTIVFNHSESNF